MTLALVIGYQLNVNVPLSDDIIVKNAVVQTNADLTAKEEPLRTKPTALEKSRQQDALPTQNLTTIIPEKEPPSMTGWVKTNPSNEVKTLRKTPNLPPKCDASPSLPKIRKPGVIMTDFKQKIHLSGIPKGTISLNN